MIVSVNKVRIEDKKVEVEVKPQLYVFVVRYTDKSGDQYVRSLISDTKEVCFNLNGNVDVELIKWFIYVLNAEKEPWEFDQVFTGERI